MDYFKQFLNSLPQPLDPEEQEQLLVKYFETKDEETREKLLVHNLKLCAKCAIDYCRKFNKFDMEDQIFSVCYEELDRSLDKFDPAKETSFAHYAINNMNLKLIRYSQNEEYYLSQIVLKIPKPDKKDDEEIDVFYFLDDGNSLQDEVQAEIFKEDIIKFIDSSKGSNQKKEMIKMYLGLGHFRRYSKAEIAAHFNCSRASAGVTVSNYLTLLQQYIANKYGSVFPDYAEKLRKKIKKFNSIEERNQYILNAYYNGDCSKSINEIAKELGVSKGCVNEVIRTRKVSQEESASHHITKYRKSAYIEQFEGIFNDHYGLNNAKLLSRTEIIEKYNLSLSSNLYYECLKRAEAVMIKKGKYTVQEIEKIKLEHNEKIRQARIEHCKAVYEALQGEGGAERKTAVQLARENKVAVCTIYAQFNFYKKHLESLNKSEEQRTFEE